MLYNLLIFAARAKSEGYKSYAKAFSAGAGAGPGGAVTAKQGAAGEQLCKSRMAGDSFCRKQPA